MSLNELLALQKKPWCNIEVQDCHVDGTLYCNSFIPPLPGLTGSTGAGSVYFTAVTDTPQNNITGNGGLETLIYDTIVKQVGGNNYTANDGIFTAPISGLYHFDSSVVLTGCTGSNGTNGMVGVYYFLIGLTIRPIYRGSFFNLATGSSSGLCSINGSITQYMTAGQTCQCIINIIDGTSDSVNHFGGTDEFSGFLVTTL